MHLGSILVLEVFDLLHGRISIKRKSFVPKEENVSFWWELQSFPISSFLFVYRYLITLPKQTSMLGCHGYSVAATPPVQKRWNYKNIPAVFGW